MPRRSSCSVCRKTVLLGRGSLEQPICRECRTQARMRGNAPVVVVCGTCGTQVKGRRGQRYCSRSCQPYELEKIARSTVAFRCSWCDREAHGVCAKGHSPVCSAECQSALSLYQRGWNTSPWRPGIQAQWTGKQRRQARITLTSDGPINRRAVFERDKWTCHLCDRTVARTKSVPHPRAATIDHLIPLALGGTHTLANVATACFECNTRKGVRACGEQLAIIG